MSGERGKRIGKAGDVNAEGTAQPLSLCPAVWGRKRAAKAPGE